MTYMISSPSFYNIYENIAKFLQVEETVFGDLQKLLSQQFQRLSPIEQAIMYWLAIEHKPMTVGELLEDVFPPISNMVTR